MKDFLVTDDVNGEPVIDYITNRESAESLVAALNGIAGHERYRCAEMKPATDEDIRALLDGEES